MAKDWKVIEMLDEEWKGLFTELQVYSSNAGGWLYKMGYWHSSEEQEPWVQEARIRAERMVAVFNEEDL